MYSEDKMNLKKMLMLYTPKEIMQELSAAAMDAADEMSDDGMNDKAKQLTILSASLDDLIAGRPFLV